MPSIAKAIDDLARRTAELIQQIHAQLELNERRLDAIERRLDRPAIPPTFEMTVAGLEDQVAALATRVEDLEFRLERREAVG